jgi:hypothetical protein
LDGLEFGLFLGGPLFQPRRRIASFELLIDGFQKAGRVFRITVYFFDCVYPIKTKFLFVLGDALTNFTVVAAKLRG